jgi:DNA-binding NtrC family response regulator
MAKKQQRKSAKAVARKREPSELLQPRNSRRLVRSAVARHIVSYYVSQNDMARALIRLHQKLFADFGDTREEVHEILRRRVARMVDRRVAPIMAAFDGQYNEAMARFERELLLVYLAEAGGGLRRTSRMYGISLSRLRRRIKELGIDISSDLPR